MSIVVGLVLALGLAVTLLAVYHIRSGLRLPPVALFAIPALAAAGINLAEMQLGPDDRMADTSVLSALGSYLFIGAHMKLEHNAWFKVLAFSFLCVTAASYLLPFGPGSLVRFVGGFMLVISVLMVAVWTPRQRE